MAFTESVLSILSFLGSQLLQWFYIFYAPFTDLNVVWILIPIYLNWIVSEIWLEKRFTSYGNAISNGVTVFWVGIDWARQITHTLTYGQLIDWTLYAKITINSLLLAYGIIVVYFGIKARSFIHYLGRVRVMTYFMLMFTPLMYGLIPSTLGTFLRIFLFLPLFYIVIEIIDRITPDPKTYEEDGTQKDFSTQLPDIPSANFNDLPPMNNLPGMNNMPPMNSRGMPPNMPPQFPPQGPRRYR